MKRILISGATGFVGRHLLASLRGRYELFAMARSIPDQIPKDDIEWIEQDLTSPLAVARLPERIDAVIHLAQSKHYREFPERADDIFGVNVQGTFNLLEYARRSGAERFVFASSGGIYGTSYEHLTESAPINPLDFYLSSKYSAELLVGNYERCFRTVLFRFFFVYGPSQIGMLVPTLMRRIQQGEPITVDGNPGLRLNPIFVEDAISVFEPALSLETSDVFNVAGDEVVTLTDLVRRCADVLGIPAEIRYDTTRRRGDMIAATEKMKQVLGVTPTTDLQTGLSLSIPPEQSADHRTHCA